MRSSARQDRRSLTTGKAQIQHDTQELLQHIWMSTKLCAGSRRPLQDVDPPEAVAAAFKDATNAKEDDIRKADQPGAGLSERHHPKAGWRGGAIGQPSQDMRKRD